MSESTMWAIAIAAFHGWAVLVFMDAYMFRCVAAFAVALIWGIAALVRTIMRLDREGRL